MRMRICLQHAYAVPYHFTYVLTCERARLMTRSLCKPIFCNPISLSPVKKATSLSSGKKQAVRHTLSKLGTRKHDCKCFAIGCWTEPTCRLDATGNKDASDCVLLPSHPVVFTW